MQGRTAANSYRFRPHRVGVAVVVAALLLTLPQSASADPGHGGPRAKLAHLEERAARLAEQYRGQLVQVDDLQHAARRAASQARGVRQELQQARQQVAQLAAEKYKTGGTGRTFRLLMSGEPQAVLDRATTLDYLSKRTVRQIKTVQQLTVKARTSRRTAQSRVAEVRRELQRLEQNKARVQRLIERYQAQAAARAERAERTSSSSASAPAPSSSIAVPGNITPRMAQVYTEIVSRFGEGYGVLCYRPDDSGEHPDGRACDFMLSSGGAEPSGAQVQRGYDIAAWAQANAERLGIMYIIYRQRIWDIRCGCGWESMEDRGSVTANHVDHVHISVF